MPRKDWSQEIAGGSLPLDLTVNPYISGDPQVPATWVELPGGGTLTYLDGSGHSQTITGESPGYSSKITIRKLVSLSGASPNRVRVGTGDGPTEPSPDTAAATSATNSATSATAAASSATAAASSASAAATSVTNAATSATSAAASALAMSGIQANQPADSAASDTVAEAYVGSVLGPCNVDPVIVSRGTATANDTTYATKTFKLYRAGSAVKTWTITTKTSGGSGGTGNWTNGAIFPKGDPYAALAGDYLTVATAKASTGVQLPAHAVGLLVS